MNQIMSILCSRSRLKPTNEVNSKVIPKACKPLQDLAAPSTSLALSPTTSHFTLGFTASLPYFAFLPIKRIGQKFPWTAVFPDICRDLPHSKCVPQGLSLPHSMKKSSSTISLHPLNLLWAMFCHQAQSASYFTYLLSPFLECEAHESNYLSTLSPAQGAEAGTLRALNTCLLMKFLFIQWKKQDTVDVIIVNIYLLHTIYWALCHASHVN